MQRFDGKNCWQIKHAEYECFPANYSWVLQLRNLSTLQNLGSSMSKALDHLVDFVHAHNNMIAMVL